MGRSLEGRRQIPILQRRGIHAVLLPESESEIQQFDEAHAFFTKYERTLQQDVKAIFN